VQPATCTPRLPSSMKKSTWPCVTSCRCYRDRDCGARHCVRRTAGSGCGCRTCGPRGERCSSSSNRRPSWAGTAAASDCSGREEPSTHRSTARFSRRARPDSDDVADEPALGRTSDPRRASQAGDRCLSSHGRTIHRPPSTTTLADVAYVLGQPHRTNHGRGFLRRADRDGPSSVRPGDPGTSGDASFIWPSVTIRQRHGRVSSYARCSRGSRRRGFSSAIATTRSTHGRTEFWRRTADSVQRTGVYLHRPVPIIVPGLSGRPGWASAVARVDRQRPPARRRAAGSPRRSGGSWS
jgi:hypothetical protein